MPIFEDRPESALLVVDVQNGVVEAAFERDAVVGRIAGLVERARSEGIPIVWVRHHGEELPEGGRRWQIVPELDPGADEPLVEKEWGDAFEGTSLETILAELQVGRLVVTGAQTDACIRCTLHGGLVRGYDVALVGDAHTTEDNTQWGVPAPEAVIAHTNIYWHYEEAPGRTAETADAAEVRLGTATA